MGRGKWDTPTDAVSRRAHDRAIDRLSDRIQRNKDEIKNLRKTLEQILKWKADLFMMGKALPPPPK